MNYYILILGAFFLLFSLLLLLLKKENSSIVLLFLGSLCFGLFIATIDHFLNTWDEQFHALVAKNVCNNGLVPFLHTNHSIGYDYKMWVGNEVWLHKQPLFIWQIALSIKLFGINELSVRIPSILMHAFTSVFIYFLGKNLLNKYVGIISSILFSISFYQLELITGKYSTDHNDVAFLFYCTGSFWAWFNYIKTNNRYWLILIGLFSGGAVLIKWLLGLIVYVIWFIINLTYGKKNDFSNFLDILISAFISFIIFIPWQLYILYNFPKEAHHEYTYNSLHIYEAIEGHSEKWNFHFNEGINELYGNGVLVPWVLLLGVIIVYRKSTVTSLKLFFLFIIVFVYVFFTLVATKMLSYTIITSPFFFISIGASIYYTCNVFKRFRFLLIFLMTIIAGLGFLNLNKIENKHSLLNNKAKILEKEYIKYLDQKLNGKEFVVFNFKTTPFGNISAMFYTDYEIYQSIPTKLEIEHLKLMNKNISCIDLGFLPEYIVNDSLILKIKKI